MGGNDTYLREELIEALDMDRIMKNVSVYNMSKLCWVNSLVLFLSIKKQHVSTEQKTFIN